MSNKPLLIVGADFVKSQIAAFTRKDGSFVAAHSDKRQAAAPEFDGAAVAKKHDNKMARKASEWDHDGYEGKKVPSSDVAGAPEFTHKEVYGHDGKTSPAGTDFSREFAAKGHQHFVMKHPGGQRSLVNTEGSNYARYHAPVEAEASAAKPATPALGAHAKALRDSSKPGDMDHWHNQIAADQMAAGDHKALSGTLKGMDTAARDHVLEHIHPDHHAGLGFETINHARSVAGYDKKFPAAKPKAAKPAKAKDMKKPTSAGGYTAPKDGDVGHEEHTQYGAYFRKGDKVKDQAGVGHEVLSHRGPQVTTTGGGSYHPTKLKFVSGSMEKSMLIVRPDLLK